MVKKLGNYQLGRTLGTGNFGKVKYATDTQDPKKTAYAIKILDRKRVEKEKMEEQLRTEIAIMKLLNHDNIVHMYEVIQSPQHIYIVLELVTGGELFDRIVEKKRFDEKTARRYYQQLMFGVHYCHSQGVFHRDLKPENLLLDANDNLKISDFGLSSLSHNPGDLLKTACGTPNYVAPEVLAETGYHGETADVWSAGVILYVMLAGHLPFDDTTPNGLFAKIEAGDYKTPSDFSKQVAEFIRRLLTVNAEKRIQIPQIFEHPWFLENVDKQKLTAAKTGHQKKVVDTNQAVFKKDENGIVTGDSAQEQQYAGVTAFELASRLVMGSLSPLVSTSEQVVRRNTQFMMNGEFSACRDRILSELEKLKAKPSVSKNGMAIKAFMQSAKHGLLYFDCILMKTVCPDLTLIEVARRRGDTLEFQKQYRNLVRAMMDVVPAQPPVDEE